MYKIIVFYPLFSQPPIRLSSFQFVQIYPLGVIYVNKSFSCVISMKGGGKKASPSSFKKGAWSEWWPGPPKLLKLVLCSFSLHFYTACISQVPLPLTHLTVALASSSGVGVTMQWCGECSAVLLYLLTCC